MADYWKSQPRKYCELCKCWLADNKPSRDFHERGKRHQDSVRRKLEELKRKGAADAKKERESNKCFQQMERAAIKKFKQDLASDPSLSAQYGEQLQALPTTRTEPKQGKKLTKPTYQPRREPQWNQTHKPKEVKQAVPETQENDWQEALSDEGFVYYWNSKTGESSWYPPTAGPTTSTLTTDEVAATTSVDATATSDVATTMAVDNDTVCSESQSDVAVTLPKENEDQQTRPTTETNIRKYRRDDTSIYGQWQEVKCKPLQPQIDFQLPIRNDVKLVTIPTTKEPKMVIKEKIMAISADRPIVGFRKRKLVDEEGGKKRMLRQRVDDDD